jgi:pimeloyl-ACP methyl ester carboxylesterase
MDKSYREVEFYSEKELCRGRLYKAEKESAYSNYCVVMAHGFGLTMDCGLDIFVLSFVEKGLNVFLFDYRHFGESEGQPRQMLSFRKQIKDWIAAIHHARSSLFEGEKKIILWGTSFSGGYVISAAAKYKDVAAIISQCPAMDGLSILTNTLKYSGLVNFTRSLAAAGLDVLCALFGKGHMMKVYGGEKEIAAMTSKDSLSGYSYIVSGSKTFTNGFLPRYMLLLWSHRPLLNARKIKCPTLLVVCKRDSVAPAYSAEKFEKKCSKYVSAVYYDIGHFDVYKGSDCERSIKEQLKFIDKVVNNI